MGSERIGETGHQSFFGDYLFDQVVSAQHFLRQLKGIIDWRSFTRRLIKLYKGEGLADRPPFNPAQLLRMELIGYLYNLSERQVETCVNENLPEPRRRTRISKCG